jgi:hypothetical protein
MGKLDFSGTEIVTRGPNAAFARGRWQLKMFDDRRRAGMFMLILRSLRES